MERSSQHYTHTHTTTEETHTSEHYLPYHFLLADESTLEPDFLDGVGVRLLGSAGRFIVAWLISDVVALPLPPANDFDFVRLCPPLLSAGELYIGKL